MGLASKIVKGASRKALEGYKEILRATLSDNMIRPEETPCDANLVRLACLGNIGKYSGPLATAQGGPSK